MTCLAYLLALRDPLLTILLAVWLLHNHGYAIAIVETAVKKPNVNFIIKTSKSICFIFSIVSHNRSK